MENTTEPSGSLNKKIYIYACALLARRRYSVHDLQKKLREKFPEQSEETATVIKLFISKKYLDDAEYARLFVRDQLIRKPQGLRMLRQKLSQKGVPANNLQQLLDEDGTTEFDLARRALEKKLRTLRKETPQKKKEKLFRFLASRGFNMDVIMKVLRTDGNLLEE